MILRLVSAKNPSTLPAQVSNLARIFARATILTSSIDKERSSYRKWFHREDSSIPPRPLSNSIRKFDQDACWSDDANISYAEGANVVSNKLL